MFEYRQDIGFKTVWNFETEGILFSTISTLIKLFKFMDLSGFTKTKVKCTKLF